MFILFSIFLSISLKDSGVLGLFTVSAKEVQIASSSSCVKSSRLYLGFVCMVMFKVSILKVVYVD